MLQLHVMPDGGVCFVGAQVANVLTQRLYEEVVPAAILDSREVEGTEGEKEFLVQFQVRLARPPGGGGVFKAGGWQGRVQVKCTRWPHTAVQHHVGPRGT